MKMEPEEGGQDRTDKTGSEVQFCGMNERGGVVVKYVFLERGGKRKKQFMVYERMSEIGG